MRLLRATLNNSPDLQQGPAWQQAGPFCFMAILHNSRLTDSSTRGCISIWNYAVLPYICMCAVYAHFRQAVLRTSLHCMIKG